MPSKVKMTLRKEKIMNNFPLFGILIVFIFISGIVSAADAHPHATIDLMESHSHNLHDEGFEENFIVHTFEKVIFSMFDFISTHLSF